MRWMGLLIAATALVGCTSTRVLKRDECWVRQTEKWPKRVTEELGPCARSEPKWSSDLVTRAVQECVAQADYRWHNRAVEAWQSGKPLPEAQSDERVLQMCMDEATQRMVVENDGLKSRIEDVNVRLDDVKGDREHYRQSNGALAEALGEAAKKPAPAAIATATATGEGLASTDSNSDTRTETVNSTSSDERRTRVTQPERKAPPKRTIPAPTPTTLEKEQAPPVQKVTTSPDPLEVLDRKEPIPAECEKYVK